MRLAVIAQISQRVVLIVLGFVFLWLLLETSAGHLPSYRGEWGLVVAILVAVAAIPWEQLVGQRGLRQAAYALGLHRSLTAVLAWTVALSFVLLCFLPLCASNWNTVEAEAGLAIAAAWAARARRRRRGGRFPKLPLPAHQELPTFWLVSSRLGFRSWWYTCFCSGKWISTLH